MGIVGGFGAPNRKRVAPVGNVAPIDAIPFVVDVVAAATAAATYVPTDVASVVSAPLPLGGRSTLVS